MIPFILFLGLVGILWGGLSLNPTYIPPNEESTQFNSQEYIFDTALESEKFQKILKDFRCVVCQNQSLADSSAHIAMNMKEAIYTKLKAGESEKEIQDFLVLRYGDFVLYNPPFKKETLVLWLGPFAFFLIGLGFSMKRFVG